MASIFGIFSENLCDEALSPEECEADGRTGHEGRHSDGLRLANHQPGYAWIYDDVSVRSNQKWYSSLQSYNLIGGFNDVLCSEMFRVHSA